MNDDATRVVEQTIRQHWGYLYATLVKQLNDFELAEDVLQDATLKALESWPKTGTPDSPRAWLLRTAKNKAIDRLRRSTNFESKQDSLVYLLEQQSGHSQQSPEALMDQVIEDDRLRLIFTCCHPALNEPARIALTLRTLGGLSVPEIAHAFLVPETTLAQRLVRAKTKIRKAGIPYKVPEASQWPERIDSVLAVIYLIFNEGHSASDGDTLLRHDLCEEAILLADMLNQLIPQQPEVMGLLALLLLHDSRRNARVNAQQQYQSLEQQNRELWDQNKIQRGSDLIKKALSMGNLGAYQLQAAISAVHAEAETFDSTDWTQIRLLYNRLYALSPTPVVQLNAIVALSYEQSAEVALNNMKKIDFTALQNYQPYHAARADLLRRTEQLVAAAQAYRDAIRYSKNKQESEFLTNQLRAIERLKC